jgi:hypothetical protein
MTTMRAKVRVSGVFPFLGDDGKVSSERLMFSGVYKSDGYPSDGSDEDNTFAKFTPSLSFDMLVNNPSLIGSFTVGDTFYVDFTPVS